MRTLVSLLMMASLSTLVVLQACKMHEPFKDVPVTKDVTFEKHIKPITSTVCISCHSQGSRDYSSYRNAFRMRQSIYQRVVVDRTMPAGKYLSDEDRALFRDWVNQGGNQ